MLHQFLRKCLYNGKPAYFHGWFQVAYPIDPSPLKGGHPGGQVLYPVALLELEDGRMVRASEAEFIFQDPAVDERLIKPLYLNRAATRPEGGGEL